MDPAPHHSALSTRATPSQIRDTLNQLKFLATERVTDRRGWFVRPQPPRCSAAATCRLQPLLLRLRPSTEEDKTQVDTGCPFDMSKSYLPQ